jgi:chromosome segregation ATPase
MKTVYSSFEEFSKRNQSILNIISNKDDIDLLKAIWDARDGEVLRLEMRLQRQAKEVAIRDEGLAEQEKKYEKAALDLERLNRLEREYIAAHQTQLNDIEKLNEKILILENDLGTISAESDQLEKILFSKDEEVERVEKNLKDERKVFEENQKEFKSIKQRNVKLENSFGSDQKYIKELELRMEKVSEENNELLKLKAEYKEQFKNQKSALKSKVEEEVVLQKNISNLKLQIEKKESLLENLSEKLNITQNEFNISIVKSKKLSAQVERLDMGLKDYKDRFEVFEKQNIELKKDNVEIVDYCESLKKEVRTLELSNEDLFSNQTELESYIGKLRLKAGRDEIKIKELEKALDEARLRKKLALNEKNLLEKELSDYKRLLSDFESRLKKPKRQPKERHNILDH